MSTVAKKLLTSTKGGEEVSVSEVFSTYVYEGTGATQNIVNDINLADEGGMVWTKARGVTQNHYINDTERGPSNAISSSLTNTETFAGADGFNNNGYSLPSDPTGAYNYNGFDYVSWTFRKAPRFFDVVKYTGDSVAGREIAHDLGCEVGMMHIFKLSGGTNWSTYHRRTNGDSGEARLSLNTNGVKNLTSIPYYWGDNTNYIAPNASVFTLGTGSDVNQSGNEYIAYLFAHNELDGLVEGDGKPVIKCGSYTANSGDGVLNLDIGFEPQFFLVKNTSNARDWLIYDNTRGFTVDGLESKYLEPNTSNAETGRTYDNVTSTGFQSTVQNFDSNHNGDTFIYLAIARDTTTVPESSDEVFAIDTRGSTGDGEEPGFRSGFPVDMQIQRGHLSTNNTYIGSRLTQGRLLQTNSTSAEGDNSNTLYDYMNGWNNLATESIYFCSWMFKRAKGFFDVVTYQGDGVAGRTVEHNLGVVPEMIWIKCRESAATNWGVYARNATWALTLNSIGGKSTNTVWWNDTEPTNTVFSLGTTTNVNYSGLQHVAYLFATVDGISKVGSYTGNGSNQTIDAGFTTGVKFLIVKRTDSTGDWIMVDSVRGLDNFLELNTTNAQASGSGITSTVAGFTVTQNATTDLNASGGSYIYYAIAN